MVYASTGSATFVYLNTAPQWRPINEGNWARIEDHVVEMAKVLSKDLIIYTGVYDRLTLKDTGDGNRTKMMFLHAADNSEKSIGIPLYFWKIVYEAESKRGVVYVTVNNIFIENVDDYHLCEKPMFTKDGVRMPKQWKPKNVAKGYSYMCEVPDFMRNIADITFHGFSPAVVMDLLYLVKKWLRVCVCADINKARETCNFDGWDFVDDYLGQSGNITCLEFVLWIFSCVYFRIWRLYAYILQCE